MMNKEKRERLDKLRAKLEDAPLMVQVEFVIIASVLSAMNNPAIRDETQRDIFSAALKYHRSITVLETMKAVAGIHEHTGDDQRAFCIAMAEMHERSEDAFEMFSSRFENLLELLPDRKNKHDHH